MAVDMALPGRLLDVALLLQLALAAIPARADEAAVNPCRAAWAAKGAPRPLAQGCPVAPWIVREVERLLAAAATHCTTSGACYDAGGERVTAQQIRVCSGGERASGFEVRVSYCLVHQQEGDTRGCSRRPGGCAWMKPTATVHVAELTFVRSGDALVLDLPRAIPGMDRRCTPLDRPHDGRCYGKAGAFEPARIPVD